ncbi:MAG: helix-turn-helix domain-containing protein, partial [Candidatus Puniceispirillaceae bacterium]
MRQNKAVSQPDFGSLIRELRIKSGLGQRELAEKIGIAASYLNDIEKDKRTAPKQIIITDIQIHIIKGL